MTAGNRAAKYETLFKSLKKHYKPVSDPPERTVLEHLLYACCLEDAKIEQADEAFAKLQQTYFDWNEVRVTTVVELSDALQSLPFANQAAQRIKQSLQALFESRYQYDIDDLRKANLGKAVAELEAWKGITPFVVSYVSQHALGGHSIPVSVLILESLVQCEILTAAEAEKKSMPGVERAIPKNKGIEFAALLHQFANELHLSPKSAAPTAVLKDLGATYKPKPKPVEKPAANLKGEGADKRAAKSNAPARPTAETKTAEAPKGAKSPETKAPAKAADTKKAEPSKSAPAAKAGDTSKSAVKKPDGKPEHRPDSKASAAPKKPTLAKGDVSPAKKPIPNAADAGKGSSKGVSKDAAKDKDAGKAKTGEKGKAPSKPESKTPDKKPKTTSKTPDRPSVGSSITKKKPK
ncbi:MAG: hypothetical protein ACK5OB_03755 [Pirellula sp.]